MSDKKDRLRAALDKLAPETIKEALCAALIQPITPVTREETGRKGKWDDFEDVDTFASFMSLAKRRFEFPELSKFTIEAGSVYLENAGRKTEITIPASVSSIRPNNRDTIPTSSAQNRSATNPRESENSSSAQIRSSNPRESTVPKPERFMNLELDT